MGFLGLAIGTGLAALFIALGALFLFSKKAKAFVKFVPAKWLPILAILLLVVGFTAGGVSWYSTAWTEAKASISGMPISTTPGAQVSYTLTSLVGQPRGSGSQIEGNLSAVAGVNDNTRYVMFIKNATAVGAGSFASNITVTRSGDVDKAIAFDCYAQADQYRSETSTTDANVYLITATSASKSLVPGRSWQQTIYLSDGSAATTSSQKETTPLTFASGTSQRTLGVLFTLPGDTAFNYLTGTQATPAINVYCNGQRLATYVIDKEGAAA